MEEMKVAAAKVQTIEALNDLLRSIGDKDFVGHKWCKKMGVNSYFLRAAVSLNIIHPHGFNKNATGKGQGAIKYSTLKTFTDKEIERIADRMPQAIRNVYAKRLRVPRGGIDWVKLEEKVKHEYDANLDMSVKKEPTEEELQRLIAEYEPMVKRVLDIKEKTMKDFTIEEIILELRLRGYEYSITKLEVYEFKGKAEDGNVQE